MRVLVTGGAGFIGSHIVEACLAAGHEVAVIDDLSTGKRENLPGEVPLHEVDIADSAGVDRVFRAVRPEHVIHQAAQISVSRSVREPAFDARVNVLGLLHVLEASARYGARSVVFASSGGVLYGDVWEPANEEHAAAPISPYGISKLAGEHYLRFFAREHGLQCTALRYGNVYGPRQDPHGEAGVVAIFLERLLRGEACMINGDGKYVRDYVFVEDVARANLLAMESADGAAADRPRAHLPAVESEWAGFRAYNVGTGVGTDVNQLEAALREALAEVLRRRGVEEERQGRVEGDAELELRTGRDGELPRPGRDVGPRRAGRDGELERRAGRDVKLPLPLPTYGPPRPGDLRSSLLDAAKIRQELGWRPTVGLEEGLRRTAEWFAERG